jgi:hypothetical protein
MRYVTSLLAGLGMYVLAVMLWDIFAWLYLEFRWRHEHFIVAQVVFRVASKWDDLYAMLPLIIGHVIGIAAFVAGFYWTFRRTSAQSSN